VDARRSKGFQDVPAASDMCTVALLQDQRSGAIGTVTASRISAGASDLLELEIRATGGGLRVTTEAPDRLEIFGASTRSSAILECGNDYGPECKLPPVGTASGWLRSLVHAHYLFFCADPQRPVPGASHGIAVQRLLAAIARRINDQL
jgi:hypothetical protein